MFGKQGFTGSAQVLLIGSVHFRSTGSQPKFGKQQFTGLAHVRLKGLRFCPSSVNSFCLSSVNSESQVWLKFGYIGLVQGLLTASVHVR